MTANSEAPTYANTIDTLELGRRLLDKVSAIFFTQNESDSNEEMLQIGNDIIPKPLSSMASYL